MSENNKNQKQLQNQSNQPNKPVNLVGLTKPKPRYLCKFCDVIMFPYPQLKAKNPYAGEGYICPKCGTVDDISYTNLKHAVKIEPVDVGYSPYQDGIRFIPNKTGQEQIIAKPKDLDPEPFEEDQIKAMGGTIIDKRLTIYKHEEY